MKNLSLFRHSQRHEDWLKKSTDRKISTVERVNDERLVAHMDDTADAVAGVEGRRRPWIVLDSPVIVAVFDVLEKTNSYLRIVFNAELGAAITLSR